MYDVLHSDGSGADEPSLVSFSDLYDEVLTADQEHGDVSVVHDSGWCLSAHRGGLVVFEHLGNGGERHMRGVAKSRVLELWERLTQGDIDGLVLESWTLGYGTRGE